jgi:hypothetical protein
MIDPNAPTRFIVQTAAANMPAKCWGNYRRVAVLEVHADMEKAPMISDRAKGTRVVCTWEKCNVGKAIRSAYAKALADAEELCNEMNAARAFDPVI